MEFMQFRKLLPLCLVLAFAFAGSAHAQLGIYGTFDGERVTGFTCQGLDGQCASSGGVARPYGGNFGVYYDFRNLGPVRIGGDLRGDVFSSNKSPTEYEGGAGVVRQYGALGGIRGSIDLPIHILRPYAEAAFGYAKSNAASTNPTLYSNYSQVEGLLGVDIAILPYMDIRAEAGAGALFGTNTHSTESIGAGVVFHLPR